MAPCNEPIVKTPTMAHCWIVQWANAGLYNGPIAKPCDAEQYSNITLCEIQQNYPLHNPAI